MTIETWVSFVITVGIETVTPGASVLLTLGHGIRFGLLRTLSSVAGDLSANTAQILLVALGTGALLAKSPDVFRIIKWLGVVYLLCVGVRQWRRPVWGGRFTPSAKKFSRSLYMEGFLTSATNPKAILFFLALFPQFIDRSEPQPGQWLILAITALLVDGLVLMIYAAFGRQINLWLGRQGRQEWMSRIAGGLLISAAGALLVFVNV